MLLDLQSLSEILKTETKIVEKNWSSSFKTDFNVYIFVSVLNVTHINIFGFHQKCDIQNRGYRCLMLIQGLMSCS